MPSINMIAARRAEKKRFAQMIYVTLFVVIAEVAIGLLLFGFVTTRIFAVGRENKRLDKELARVQPTVEKIQEYEAEIKKLRPRMELLADSREQTLLWHRVLNDLSRSMPQKTWLSSMTVSQPTDSGQQNAGSKAGPTLNLKGVSASQGLIGEAMLRLSQCPEFERVDLSYTQMTANKEVDSIEFQLAAVMKPFEQPKGGNSGNGSD
jgi:Tfp pilus assembly protein PilN